MMGDNKAAIDQLEHVKTWLGVELLNRKPADVSPAEWLAWVEWNLPDFQHAIDHAIAALT